MSCLVSVRSFIMHFFWHVFSTWGLLFADVRLFAVLERPIDTVLMFAVLGKAD